MRLRAILVLVLIANFAKAGFGQAQFEFENNWLMWVSFQSGQDEGIETNLDDNFAWMREQGYTHLRFFGIHPSGQHAFPSPTLDANGYPNNPLFESVLPILVSKADQWNIVINFDGWESLAEANHDTTALGVGYLTSTEIADVVREVLALGIEQISDEQFGTTDLQAIYEATSATGARHEITNIYWWPHPGIADEQLGSVFCYYTYDQTDLDTIWASTYPPSNVGHLHIGAESAHYYGIPFSVAVGSFGNNLNAANWKNILLFSQIQHHPERFSVEEQDTDFTIWNPGFNFMADVGDEILSLETLYDNDRPMANLVLDLSLVDGYASYPAYEAGNVSVPAIVNTFTMLGYRVVATANSCLPEADMYYLLVAGGAGPGSCAELPDYVMPLLNGIKPVFLHPAYGIPDENDSGSWAPARSLFGLPGGDTQTLVDAIPQSVDFDGSSVRWGGVHLWILPLMERIISSEIDDAIAEVVLSSMIDGQDLALLVRNGERFLINSNVIHLDAAFILSSLLGGPLNAPATADIALSLERTAILAEYDTDIDINLPWSEMTRLRYYDATGELVSDSSIDLAGHYVTSLARGELVVMTTETSTAVDPSQSQTASLLGEHRIYPNPFNSNIVIEYNLRRETNVTVSIYDPRGCKLLELTFDRQCPGSHTFAWNGRDQAGDAVASGVYFYRIQAGPNIVSRKMILLK